MCSQEVAEVVSALFHSNLELDLTQHFTIPTTVCVCVKSLQSCPTLCHPMDCSPPGPLVHGILQARILEWVAISFSRGSSPPRDRTQVSYISCSGRLYH